MLGQKIIDDDGIEGAPSRVDGLGLLDITTVMKPQKRLARSTSTYLPTGDQVTGYEIHIGETSGPDCDRAWLSLDGRGEGAASPDGKIMGCYLHGLFTADQFRAAFLAQLGAPLPVTNYAQGVEDTLDQLATHLETHMDIDQLLNLAGTVG
jgi:adenosylcobyric acid synthase